MGAAGERGIDHGFGLGGILDLLAGAAAAGPGDVLGLVLLFVLEEDGVALDRGLAPGEAGIDEPRDVAGDGAVAGHALQAKEFSGPQEGGRVLRAADQLFVADFVVRAAADAAAGGLGAGAGALGGEGCGRPLRQRCSPGWRCCGREYS